MNLDTGELYKGILTPLLPRVGGRWMRVYQDALFGRLKQNPQIKGNSMRVLLYLQSVVTYQNLLPGTGATAKELGLRQSHASRAYKELIEADFIIKRQGNYYFNPFIYWKGTQKQMQQACCELLEPQKRYLIEGQT